MSRAAPARIGGRARPAGGPLRVLTWNLFHGRAGPAAGQSLLGEFAGQSAGWAWPVVPRQRGPALVAAGPRPASGAEAVRALARATPSSPPAVAGRRPRSARAPERRVARLVRGRGGRGERPAPRPPRPCPSDGSPGSSGWPRGACGSASTTSRAAAGRRASTAVGPRRPDTSSPGLAATGRCPPVGDEWRWGRPDPRPDPRAADGVRRARICGPAGGPPRPALIVNAPASVGHRYDGPARAQSAARSGLPARGACPAARVDPDARPLFCRPTCTDPRPTAARRPGRPPLAVGVGAASEGLYMVVLRYLDVVLLVLAAPVASRSGPPCSATPSAAGRGSSSASSPRATGA